MLQHHDLNEHHPVEKGLLTVLVVAAGAPTLVAVVLLGFRLIEWFGAWVWGPS